MRRADREITDFDELIAVMRGCDVCRLALHDEPYPYILPLNFGLEADGGTVRLYFHGADTGTKYDLIARNPNASFEMDRGHELILDDEHGNCTMTYESVIGQGRITVVPDSGKEHALRVLMARAGLPVFHGGHPAHDRAVPDRGAHDRQAPGEKARLSTLPQIRDQPPQAFPAAAGLLSYCRKSADEIGECAHFRLRARNARRVTGGSRHRRQAIWRLLCPERKFEKCQTEKGEMGEHAARETVRREKDPGQSKRNTLRARGQTSRNPCHPARGRTAQHNRPVP